MFFAIKPSGSLIGQNGGSDQKAEKKEDQTLVIAKVREDISTKQVDSFAIKLVVKPLPAMLDSARAGHPLVIKNYTFAFRECIDSSPSSHTLLLDPPSKSY